MKKLESMQNNNTIVSSELTKAGTYCLSFLFEYGISRQKQRYWLGNVFIPTSDVLPIHTHVPYQCTLSTPVILAENIIIKTKIAILSVFELTVV